MRNLLRSGSALVLSLIEGRSGSDSVRGRVLSSMGGLVALRIGFSGLSFLGTVALARILGAEGYGTYSYALAWVLLLGIPAILGTDQLLVREVATSLTRGDWPALRGLLRAANGAVLTSSLTLAALAALGAGLWATHWTSATYQTFLITLILLPVIALTRVRQGTMQGLHQVASGALPEQLIQPALFLGLITGAAWLGPVVAPAAMALQVASAAVAFGAGAWLLHRAIPLPARSAEPIYRWAEWGPSALRLMFVASANVLCGQADTLILGTLKGPEAVGTYSISHRGADFITFIQQAQNTAFASTAAGLFAAGDLARLQAMVTRLTRWMVIGALPLALVMIVFGNYFLRFYGPQFAGARLTLAIMGTAQFLNVSFGPAILLLTMTGHENDAARAIGFGAVANIILTFLLVPGWGAEGAAVAYGLSVVIWNLWMAAAIYRRLGLHATALGRLPLGWISRSEG